MNVDALLDAFGNVPSILLNAAIALRSPIEYLHKYPHFFEEAHDFESMLEFFATETLLQDSLPVIGEIFRVCQMLLSTEFVSQKPNEDRRSRNRP
jgi:polyhydroxyalkanoate synthase subunit PhaC